MPLSTSVGSGISKDCLRASSHSDLALALQLVREIGFSMANGAEFSLPGSGLDVIKKIVHAYALCGDKEVPLGEIAQKAGMNTSLVSRNHGFLTSIGVIEGGNKKKLTVLGQKLGVAISHDDKEAIAGYIRQTIESTEVLKSILDMVRVQGGIPEATFAGKVATHLGKPGGTAGLSTGVTCVIEYLKESEQLIVVEGKYQLRKIAESKPEVDSSEAIGVSPPTASPQPLLHTSVTATTSRTQQWAVPTVPIHINIELHLPASSEQTVYDAIFAASVST